MSSSIVAAVTSFADFEFTAYSGVLRTLIPGLSDRSFRFKPITDSGIIRPFFT